MAWMDMNIVVSSAGGVSQLAAIIRTFLHLYVPVQHKHVINTTKLGYFMIAKVYFCTAHKFSISIEFSIYLDFIYTYTTYRYNILSILFHICIVYSTFIRVCITVRISPTRFHLDPIILLYNIYKSVKKNTFMSKRHTTIIHVIGIKYLYVYKYGGQRVILFA